MGDSSKFYYQFYIHTKLSDTEFNDLRVIMSDMCNGLCHFYHIHALANQATIPLCLKALNDLPHCLKDCDRHYYIMKNTWDVPKAFLEGTSKSVLIF